MKLIVSHSQMKKGISLLVQWICCISHWIGSDLATDTTLPQQPFPLSKPAPFNSHTVHDTAVTFNPLHVAQSRNMQASQHQKKNKEQGKTIVALSTTAGLNQDEPSLN